MSHFTRSRTWVSLAVFAACAPAHAEQETLVITSQQSQLPEVATATRTTTPAKLVPQTIDSLSAEELTAFGAPSLSEALAGVPGVNANGDTRFDGINIRGFSASNDFYLDGFRDDMQYTRDLGNIERIEVLKGPAAVLYGRGSTGGIVNRVSKVPHAGDAASVSARIGSHDYQRLAADLNGEVNQQVQVRLNIAQEDYGSFRHGVEGKRTLLAPSLNWDINDDVSWLIQYEQHSHNRVPDRGIPAVNGSPAEVPASSVYSDTSRDFIDDDVATTRSRITWAFHPEWQLRQQLSYTKLDSQFDNTYVARVSGDQVTRQRFQQDLQANNLISNTETEGTFNTGPIAHRILIGLEQGWQERSPKLYRNANSIPSGNLYQPESLPTYNGPMSVFSDATHKVRSYGIYVQDQLQWGDWIVLAGLRHDDFTVTTHRHDTHKEETISSNSLSPRLGVVWTPVQEHALYASYSQTYSPVGGGVIGITPGDKHNHLDPEHSRLYETGVKSDWLEGRISTTLSVYRLEMYNRRMRDPNDQERIILTGLQRTDGIELSSRALLTDEFSLRGGIGLQDAKYVEADASEQGKRPTNVSRLNGELFVAYQSASDGWFGETGFVAVGDRYADRTNTTKLPGYARFDARLGYQWQAWRTQLSVENLLDKDYYLSATSSTQIQPGAPREFYLTASYQF
ncbi:TonB-dependent siderophore receptor [Vibrio cholerae]|uniref:TonB-dependent receptor n=1 Tax=Vibrio cholerae TaxID=666 RepID=UPI00396794CB